MNLDDGTEIITAILCDDIRIEDNGKFMLLGVYSGGIIVPQMPIKLSYCLYLEAIPTDTEPKEYSVKVDGPDGLALQIKAKFSAKESGKIVSLHPPPFGIEVSKPGDIEASISTDEENWFPLFSKSIITRDVSPSTPISSPPPSEQSPNADEG